MNPQSQAIILNADYSFINTVSIKKAFCLIEKGKVTVEKWTEKFIRTMTAEFPVPMILRLKKFVTVLYKRRIQWKSKNVFIRDDFQCQYCGKQNLSGTDLTIDHVIPRSRGGKNTYENTVTSCKGCNNYKDDKLLSELDMSFFKSNWKPHHPNFAEFIVKKEKLLIEKVHQQLL